MVQGKKASKSKELADALKGQAKIITVTLETFPFVIELIGRRRPVEEELRRHRRRGSLLPDREAAAALKQALGIGSGDEAETGPALAHEQQGDQRDGDYQRRGRVEKHRGPTGDAERT